MQKAAADDIPSMVCSPHWENIVAILPSQSYSPPGTSTDSPFFILDSLIGNMIATIAVMELNFSTCV